MSYNTAPVRILFMGTPEFAVPSLHALHSAQGQKQWQVVAVATQPDRPAGRGKQLLPGPVKRYALEAQLPVLQPARLRKAPDTVAMLRDLAPDLLVVAAYGLILPAALLEIPRYGSINVHASLLPAYRGASPITAAILDGQVETGVSMMLMDEGMDTGPVLTQAREPIRPDDTTASLSARLAQLGATLLVHTLPHWLTGQLPPIPQTELPGAPSICRMIQKEAGHIHWRQPAAYIERMVRAYTPWPSAYTIWRGEPFKIVEASVVEGAAPPGKVVTSPDGIAVGTGEDLLLLQTVQPAGKRSMDIRSFINGAPDFAGAQLADG
jgi:methionyl-tRNA formyltransferase